MGNYGSGPINVDTFRMSISKSILPPLSSITVEGLFNEYFFDTGRKGNTNEVLDTSYVVASCVDPISNELERYVSVGLNCRDDGKNYRNGLNLVLVLDISGSMGSIFSITSHSSESVSNASEDSKLKKITVAVQVLQEITKTMRPSDRLGVVLFDDRVELLQPIRKMDMIDTESLLEKLDQVCERGGTNMEIGFSKGVEILEDLLKEDTGCVENSNRIIFLTDAMPNIGGGSNSLLNLSKRAAQKSKIYTTFIGVGLDFNTDLVTEITKVRGSNYFSVHSAKQFKKILNDDFNYIVTPSAFDAVVLLESEAYEIEKVYGSPYADESTGTLLKIETVNASAKEEAGVKGGMILLKLKEKLTSNTSPSTILKLTLRYEDLNGNKHQNTTELNLDQLLEQIPEDNGKYGNNGIRKAIVLTKYVLLLRDIIQTVNHRYTTSSDDTQQPTQTTKTQLTITNSLKKDLVEFRSYYLTEIEKLGDKSLAKELDVLDQFRYAEQL
jgi:Ca-activated chloride channel family protein